MDKESRTIGLQNHPRNWHGALHSGLEKPVPCAHSIRDDQWLGLHHLQCSSDSGTCSEGRMAEHGQSQFVVHPVGCPIFHRCVDVCMLFGKVPKREQQEVIEVWHHQEPQGCLDVLHEQHVALLHVEYLCNARSHDIYNGEIPSRRKFLRKRKGWRNYMIQVHVDFVQFYSNGCWWLVSSCTLSSSLQGNFLMTHLTMMLVMAPRVRILPRHPVI